MNLQPRSIEQLKSSGLTVAVSQRSQSDGKHPRGSKLGSSGGALRGSAGSRSKSTGMFGAPRDDVDDHDAPTNSTSLFMPNGREPYFSSSSQASSSHGSVSASAYYGVGSSGGPSNNGFPAPPVSFSGNRSIPPSFAAPSAAPAPLGRSSGQVQAPGLSHFSNSNSNAGTGTNGGERNGERASSSSSFPSASLHQPGQGSSSPSRVLSNTPRNPITSASPGRFRLPASSALSRISSFPPASTPSSNGSSTVYFESSALDSTEFPGLPRTARRNSQSGVGNVSVVNPPSSSTFSAASSTSGQAPRRPAMYGLLTKSREDEFTMHTEDFPALPAAAANSFRQAEGKSSFAFSNSFRGLSDPTPLSGSVPVEPGREVGSARSSTAGIIGQRVKAGGVHVLQSSLAGTLEASQPVNNILTFPDGRVTNIPSTMVNDQFGIVGLLTFIRAAESEANLVALALGSDLTSLGLNLSSADSIYDSFTSPFAEWPSRPQDIDYVVPLEYMTHAAVGDKLAPIKLHRYCEDLLFYLYYHRYVTSMCICSGISMCTCSRITCIPNEKFAGLIIF